MKKPEAFTSWCKAHGIPARSHDESVAWAAWRHGYDTANNEACGELDKIIEKMNKKETK